MKLLKKRPYLIIAILFIILLLFVPYVVNKLMGISITHIHGDSNTWITFLGSYIGSIVSGIITFLGVLLSLEFTKSQSKKDKLPEKIDNLEEALEIIEKNITALESFINVTSPEQLLMPAHFRQTVFYQIDARYKLSKKPFPNIDEYTVIVERKIRKHLIKVNSKAYQIYRRFSFNLKEKYINCISPINDKLIDFEKLLVQEYQATQGDIIMTSFLSNLKLSDEHNKLIHEIIGELYFKEKDYLYELFDTFIQFQEELLNILHQLRNELDKEI